MGFGPEKPLRAQFEEETHAPERMGEVAETIAERHAELNHWCGWQRRRNESLLMDLGPLVEAIEAGHIPIEEIPETFEAAYCTWWSEKTDR